MLAGRSLRTAGRKDQTGRGLDGKTYHDFPAIQTVAVPTLAQRAAQIEQFVAYGPVRYGCSSPLPVTRTTG